MTTRELVRLEWGQEVYCVVLKDSQYVSISARVIRKTRVFAETTQGEFFANDIYTKQEDAQVTCDIRNKKMNEVSDQFKIKVGDKVYCISYDMDTKTFGVVHTEVWAIGSIISCIDTADGIFFLDRVFKGRIKCEAKCKELNKQLQICH